VSGFVYVAGRCFVYGVLSVQLVHLCDGCVGVFARLCAGGVSKVGEAQEAQNHAAPQETRQAEAQALMEGSSSSSCSANGARWGHLILQQQHTQQFGLARLVAWFAMCCLHNCHSS